MSQFGIVDHFLEEVIQAIAEKVAEDCFVDAELILDKVSSPMLLDIYRLYKDGTPKQILFEAFQEEIEVHTAIVDTLKGMLELTYDLLDEDTETYSK